MADWTLPTETTQYLQVLANLKDRDVDAATMRVNPYVNPPVNTIVFSRAAHPYTIQEWDGTAWVNKIISVASGGTGAANLDDFKASLGLGSMAYQNASTVAISGGNIGGVYLHGATTIDITGVAYFKGSALFYADASGVAFRLMGRASDNYMAILFNTVDLSAEWARLYSDRPAHIFTNAHFMPSSTDIIQLGAAAARFNFIYGRHHNANSDGGGYFVDGLTNFGFYYSGPHAALSMNSGAATPGIMINHGTSNVVIGGVLTTNNVWIKADSASNTISFVGRPGDNMSSVYFYSNASVLHNYIRSGGLDNLSLWGASGYALYLVSNQFYPSHNVGLYLGIPTNRWYAVYVASVYADGITATINMASPNFTATYAGGFRWADRADAGFYWNGAVGPELKHATAGFRLGAANFEFFEGAPYYTLGKAGMIPYVNATMFIGGSNNYFYQAFIWYGTVVGSSREVKNILRPESLGLNFINRLEPVEYRYKISPDRKNRHGVVTEQVLEALQGVEFDGIDEESMGLNYSELIGPIIKAIQELDRKVENAKAQFLSKQ